MELRFEDGDILIEGKVETALDAFVFEFVELLERVGIKYVIVSGYLAILFGRSRGTEDIDVLSERFESATFKKLYTAIMDRRYYFLNSGNPETLYEMLSEGLGVRIAKENTIIPNIEFKFVKNEIDEISLKNRLRVVVNQRWVYVSPIELQIAYKLYLGSLNDIEDAVYLWEIFKDKLDLKVLHEFMKKLGVNGEQYGIG